MRSDKKIKYGIVQGRLIQSPKGCLQWFPQEHWRSEFFIAAALGIDYIELIAERDYNANNPLWSDNGNNEILSLCERNGLVVHAVCDDYVIDHPLIGSNAGDSLEKATRLIQRGGRLGAKKYVLPLFEKGELNTDNFDAFRDPIRHLADAAGKQDMIVCLETILNGEQLLKFLKLVNHPQVRVVFDTGNRVSFGHNLYADIVLLGQAIEHVHIKDKNKTNENVYLGTGLVNFYDVFRALKKIGYSGPYTFETYRGSDPIKTARYHMAVTEYFEHEAKAHTEDQ